MNQQGNPHLPPQLYITLGTHLRLHLQLYRHIYKHICGFSGTKIYGHTPSYCYTYTTYTPTHMPICTPATLHVDTLQRSHEVTHTHTRLHTHMPTGICRARRSPTAYPCTAKQRCVHIQLHTLTYTLVGNHTYIHTHLDMLLRSPTPRVTEPPLPRNTLKTLTQAS